MTEHACKPPAENKTGLVWHCPVCGTTWKLMGVDRWWQKQP